MAVHLVSVDLPWGHIKEVLVPLSEHEQKLLEQMERALYAEDPRFASHMKGSATSAARKRIVLGIAVALVGLGLVVAGVSTELIVLGVLGFAAMVGGVAWVATPKRPSTTTLNAVGGKGASRATSARPPRGRARGPKRAKSGTLMQRMEQRWEKRRRDQQG